MTDIFRLITLTFKVPELHKMIIEHEMRKANLVRCIIITGLAIPIATILSLYCVYGSFSGSGEELLWQVRLSWLSGSMAVINAILFLLGLFLYRAKENYDALRRILPHLVLLSFALWGMLSAVYDQAIGNSIIAFLLGYLLITTSLLIRPFFFFIYLTAVYLGFCYGVSATQSNPSEVLFNILDGLCIFGISFGIAWVFWDNNMTRYKQARLISAQQLELSQQNEQLVISSKALEKSNASKDQFFSILAHDLRGPIASTMALTELLEQGIFDEDPEELKNVYRLLQESLDNSAKLLENVLLWSRNQAGMLFFKPTNLDVYETVQSNIEILNIVSAHKNICVKNLVQKGIHVEADLDMINTVLRNLLSNAIKFTPNYGFVEILSDVTLEAQSGKSLLQITIADHGTGMNATTLDNLFKIEKKMIGLGTNNEKGTGLGLILCKDFIEKHGGSISVESKENEGSKFIITLPGQK